MVQTTTFSRSDRQTDKPVEVIWSKLQGFEEGPGERGFVLWCFYLEAPAL